MSKTIFRFYFKSMIKNPIVISMYVLFIVAGLAVNSIVGTADVANYTLVFILPSVVWMIISTAIYAINLYAKSKVDGTELMFASMAITRTKNVLFRSLAIFIIVFVSNLILISLTLLPVIIRIKDFQMIAALWSIVFLASILIIFFFISIFSLICSMLPMIPAVIVAVILSLVFSFGAIGARMAITHNDHNSLTWSKNNRVNYANMLYVNSNSKINSKYRVVLSKNDKHDANNNLGDDSLNKESKINAWLNPGEWIVNPISSIFGSYYTHKQDLFLETKDSYRFSLHKIKNIFKNDISQISSQTKKGEWVFVAPQDTNPFEEQEDTLVKEMVSISRRFKDKFNNSMSSDKNLDIWINRLKSDKIWRNLNLSNTELDMLKYWTGFNEDARLMVYLSKYGDLLKNKLKNIKKELTKFKVPLSHINMFNFILNNKIVRENVFNIHSVVTPTEIKNKFPFLQFKDLAKPADLQNIIEMKNIIHFDSNNKAKILLQNNSSIPIDLSNINKKFSNFKTTNEWINYIEKNKELGTLENIYFNMQRVLQGLNKNIREISFNENSVDIYKMDGYFKVKSVPFSQTYGITSLIILILSIALFVVFVKTYKNKNIR